MPIQSACPGCGKLLAVADDVAGKKARCPACSTIYTVPSQSTSAQPLTAQSNPFQQQFPSDSNEPLASPTNDFSAADATRPRTSIPADEMFWMRAIDGSIYGPTDRENLNRWFREGRVGAGYFIRQGESGLWEDAAIFRQPAANVAGLGGATASTNPYAAQTGSANAPGTGLPLHKYPKADRGVIVLVMGILSFALCFIFGIIAIVMGRSALNDINAGLANPNDRPMVQIGFWLGVASVILNILGIGLGILFVALSAANQL